MSIGSNHPPTPVKPWYGLLRRDLRRVWRRHAFRWLGAIALAGADLGARYIALMSHVVAAMLYWLRPFATRRDLQNLARAFPDLGAARRRQILRASLVDGAVVGLESMQLMAGRRSREQLLAGIRSADLTPLDTARARGRGVIVVSAHIGNFTMVPIYLARQGYPVHLIFREARYVPRGLYPRRLRELGVIPIDADDSAGVARALLSALRGGGVVMIYLDQGMKTGGVPVQFLGKTVAMPDGPVVLARRTGAPVLAAFYEPPCQRLAMFGPLPIGGRDVPVATDVQSLADLAAREIRTLPEYWSWRYRRWSRSF